MAYKKNYNNEEKKTVFEKKDEFYEDLANKIIQRMEDDIKYQKAWMVVEQLPYNPATGTVYQGSNAVNLLCSGRGDPRWLTFKQIQDASAKDKAEYRVKKGEKAETIIIYTPFAEKDSNGNIVRDENGKPKLVRDEQGNPKLTLNVYKVFNAEQIEGYPPLEITGRDNPSFEPAEKLIEAMKKDGVDFKHHTLDKAYYSPGQDAVRVPPIEAFSSSEAYYRTVIHELSHATGHEKRLNRDQSGSMSAINSEDLKNYAKEELTAEMSSYFTGASIGIPYNPEVHENHAAYLKSWLSVLKDEETGLASKEGIKFLREACESGKKSCSYQLDKLEKYLALEQTNDLKQDEVKKVSEINIPNSSENPNVQIIPPKKQQNKMAVRM